MEMRFAYLAEDKVYLKDSADPPRLVESAFAQNALDRAVRDRQRNAWKSNNPAEGFARQLVWRGAAVDPAARIVQMTAMAAASADELYYAMNIDLVGGLFIQHIRDGSERRLLHRQGLRLRDLCPHPNGTLAMSLQMPDGTANIATLEPGGRGVREITEGDSIDQAPRWMPGEPQRIVFQSAGVGRDQLGHPAGVGPYAIVQLDLQRGDLTTLLEDTTTDFLMPGMSADGTLHYIRRPYEPRAGHVRPLKILTDILFFPFRLVRMLIALANFMSIMFARKPLITAGGPQREPTERRHMMLYGKMIDAENALNAIGEGESPSLVPPTWELMRRSPSGQETSLAKGVLAYDLNPDGTILYTNGSAVFAIRGTEPPQKLCEGKLIEHVVAMI